MPGRQSDELPAGGETRWRAARRALLLVLFVAVPAVFDTGVRPSFALPKFTVVALGAMALVVLAAAEWATGNLARTWRNPLAVPVLLLVGWAAVSTAASAEPSTSLFGDRESRNGLMTTVAFAVVFFATAEAFDRERIRTALRTLWFGAGIVVLFYGALQLRDQAFGGGRWDPFQWRNVPRDWTVWSTLGNPNDLAGFLAMLLPIGLVLLAFARTPRLRAATAVLLLLLTVELAATRSRGALLGAAVALLAMAWWFRHAIFRRERLAALVGGALLGLGVVTVTWVLAETSRPVRGGDLLATGEGTTGALRLELWQTAWRMAEDHALLGVGPDRFASEFDEFRSEGFVRSFGPELLATDPHNLFMDRLATEGIPGLLILIYLLIATVMLFRRTTRDLGWRSSLPAPTSPQEDQVVVGAIGAALLAMLIQATVNRQDIALDFCTWVLLGLLCACGRRRPQRARRGRNRAATATSTAAIPTPSATHEMALPLSPSSPSSSDPPAADTSTTSLHHS